MVNVPYVPVTLPLRLPVNPPLGVLILPATIEPAVIAPAAVIALTVIEPDPSRCTKVLGVAAIACVFKPNPPLEIKLMPGTIELNPATADVVNVSLEKIAYIVLLT